MLLTGSFVAKRRVFISYNHSDEGEVLDFLERWGIQEKVFTARIIGISETDDFIDSDSPEYVMSQIRKKYLQDATVTIV